MAGLDVHLLGREDAAQVVMRIVIRLIAARVQGALEPGQRFVVFAFFDQVSADIVVGIAEFRVNLDGLLALGDGVVDFALIAVSPP